MNVKELINELQKLPQDMPVHLFAHRTVEDVKVYQENNIIILKSENLTQQEKNIEELKKSKKVISEPNAKLQVRTYKIPEAIQNKINKVFEDKRRK